MEAWKALFEHSSFFCLEKKEASIDLLPAKFELNSKIDRFHPERKKEYLLGRYCALKAYGECTGKELTALPSQENRAPLWPSEVVGSISHNQDWIGAAVADGNKLRGLGIDFEVMKRVKEELAKQILTEEDLGSHDFFSREELLTLIFSAKESLYKALAPAVQKFFGFEAAAVVEIDEISGRFKIQLREDLNSEFGPKARSAFEGRFLVFNGTCLTVLEIQ